MTTQSDTSALAEWRAHWPMVVAAMAGLSFATVSIYSMGLFMEPLSREFGWTRAQISVGLSIVALFAVPLSPFAGALIDRWGSRRLGIPGVILSALAFAAFSLATGSLSQWYVLWVCYALVAIAIKTTVWTAAVSSVFQKGRGLALAVVPIRIPSLSAPRPTRCSWTSWTVARASRWSAVANSAAPPVRRLCGDSNWQVASRSLP